MGNGNEVSLEAAFEMAATHHQAGRLSDAEDIYRSILLVHPQQPDVNHNLGLLARQLGQDLAAIPHLSLAHCMASSSEQYLLSYAIGLCAVGEVLQSLAILDTAISRGMGGTSVLSLRAQVLGACLANAGAGISTLANALNRMNELFNGGQYAQMELVARSALPRHPGSGAVWKALGDALRAQQKTALHVHERAAELLPADASALNNLAVELTALDRLVEAAQQFRQIVALTPLSADAHYNLGAALFRLNRYEDAIPCFMQAIHLRPDFAAAHATVGVIFQHCQRHEAGVPYLRRAIELEPDTAYTYSNLLFWLCQMESTSTNVLYTESLRFGTHFETKFRKSWRPHPNSRKPGRQLRVGFVSPDLRNHAVSSFLEPILLQVAGSERYSLFAYYNQPIEDGVSQRLKGYFDKWLGVSELTDDALAQRVREDAIDILIDLTGHTALNRLPVFARKPTPVQVSWMGYPGTTGLTTMDYYLADRFFLPPGSFDNHFVEKIVYLPATAPFSLSKHAPPVNALPALNNGYITFGSFNRPGKISQSVVGLWAQLLRSLPNARMVLGAMPQKDVNLRMVEWFAHEGIAKDRLSFYPVCGIDEYLALHHQVDICLDTFPYNGGTTSWHALTMGVPTLTLAGDTPASRTGAFMLGHMELSEFLAHDKEDFVRKGLAWRDNFDQLSQIRAELRERYLKSAIGQPALVAAGFERALQTMWQRWCMGLPPKSFAVDGQTQLPS